MIALAFLAAQIAAAQAAPVPQSPPQDWSALPPLRIRRVTGPAPDLSGFVRAEVAAGRCASAVHDAQGWSLKIDLAVLATPEGRVRRVTPRAIACPTVEQYAAGILIGTTRDSVDTGSAKTDTWYRTSMIFAWGQ